MKKTLSILLILMVIASTSFGNLAVVFAQEDGESPVTQSDDLEQDPLEKESEEKEAEIEEEAEAEPEEETETEAEPEEEKENIEERKTEAEENKEEKENKGMVFMPLAIGPQAEGNDLGNIFTFDYLTIDGEDIEDGDVIEIDEDTIVHLGFTWNTQGRNAQAGDWAEIALSDVFEMVTIPDQPILVEGVNVGNYSITDGVLRFDFNENIEQDDVQNGFVDLGLEFNLEKFRENIEQEIVLNDKEKTTLNVIARPTGDVSGIDKEGHPDNQHDAREITWTIDVINTNDEGITDATVKDIIPDGLGEARDFVINHLNIGFDGDIEVGDIASVGAPTTTANGFEVELGNMTPFTGYRIQYTTTIEDYNKQPFTNDATFEYGETSLPAEATVGGLTRSNPIEKDGWVRTNTDTDTIRWRIDVNKNGQEIGNARVVDTLPDGLTIIENSIRVVRITQDGDSWTEGDAHGGTFTGFPMVLGSLTADDAYRIYFDTSVDWSGVNSGEYQENNGFLNKAILYDGDEELNDDDHTVNFQRDPILEKVGVSNVNYNDKTITWTVTVNKAKHPLTNVVVTDYLPEGLELLEENIIIESDTEESNVISNSTITTVNDDENEHDGKTKLEITLNNVGTETITIKYTTSITDFTINNFINAVGMTGDGVGEGGSGRDAEIKPAANSFNKSFKGIDYNAKTIDWEVRVNPIREAISELVIEDTFPNKGMILLPDSVVVTGPVYNTESEEYEIVTLERGTHYTLAPRTEGEGDDEETGYHKGFILTLLEDALPLDHGQLVVTYKTSYDPQLEVEGNTLDPHVGREGGDQARVYKNRVHFTGETENGNEIDVTREAQTTVRRDSWNSGKKEGQLIHFDGEGNKVNGWVSGSERKIAWQLYFNYQEQNLGTGVVVEDILDYQGKIDQESIKVSVYDVKPNGTTEITGMMLLKSNYEVEFDTVEKDIDGETKEYEKFTLTFNDNFEVEKRYVIEFTTSVPDVSQEKYTNNANVKVGDVDYPYSATLNYDKHDDFLEKGTLGVDGTNVFTGDEVDWEVTVNESLSIIKDAVITDTISAGLVYVNGSLEIAKLVGSDEVALAEGADYTLDVNTEGEETVLTIDLEEDLENTLILRYTTVVTATEGQVNNTISLDGSAIEEIVVKSEKLSARQFSSVGGEWAPNRGVLRVTKVDAETEETIINEATFTLWYDLNGERQQFGDTEYTTENGVLEIGNLPLRTYYLREAAAPTGYVLSEEELEIVVDTAYGTEKFITDGGNFENTKEKINITGTKEWNGGEFNRPESIQIQLYQDGEAYGEPVTLDGTEDTPWTYTWTGLDRTDINGNEYKYTIDEVEVPENYVKEGISEDGLTVTNTYVIPRTEITGIKEWVGGPEERPSIELQLFRDGEAYGEPITLENGETEYTWTDLDKTDRNGKAYVYRVDEVNVPENYKKEISADGLTVKNTFVPDEEDTVIIEDEEVPLGGAKLPGQGKLPQTGGTPAALFLAAGFMTTLTGVFLRKKRRDSK